MRFTLKLLFPTALLCLILAQGNKATQAAPVAVSTAAGRPINATTGREWHVAPQPLTAIAASRQFRTIGQAAGAVQPGDRVLIHSGVYRESVVIAKEKSGTALRPIRFEAAPTANVAITGADRLAAGWQKEGGAKAGGAGENIFSVAWPHRFITWSATGTHPDDDYHRVIGRAEQVFVSGYALRQVLSREQMSRGTFYVDLDAKRLYVQASNNEEIRNQEIRNGNDWGSQVEASTRGVLWDCRADYVRLRGVRFRYAANQAQQAAAQFRGRGDVIEDCVFERTNSIGAGFFAPDQIVRRCTFQDNGQMGWSANTAHNLLFSEGLTRSNNTKNFSRGWEAGGDKIVLCRGVIIERSRFIENRGTGIWFDIGNEASTIRNCLIADNEDAGIFYEISYGLRVHDNVIIGNGMAGSAGAWGAASGVSLSSSPNCVVERNLIIGNKEGFNFREQGRRTPRIGQKEGAPEVWVWNHDQTIRNNVLAFNRDAQTWGWFDVDDERHWPAAMQQKKSEGGQAATDIARDYNAKDKSGEPSGLSLETLHLVFANNLYAAQDGQGIFNWGVTWKRHKMYGTPDAVRRELKLEQGSVLASFVFNDYLTRDFRVPPDSPALRMNCYPRGEVPGARLGVLNP